MTPGAQSAYVFTHYSRRYKLILFFYTRTGIVLSYKLTGIRWYLAIWRNLKKTPLWSNKKSLNVLTLSVIMESDIIDVVTSFIESPKR